MLQETMFVSSEEHIFTSGGNDAKSSSVSVETQAAACTAIVGGGSVQNPPEQQPLPLTATRGCCNPSHQQLL